MDPGFSAAADGKAHLAPRMRKPGAQHSRKEGVQEGAPYYRRPTDFVESHSHESKVQDAVVETDLNHKATSSRGEPIMCRDLSMQWALDRQKYHAAKAHDKDARFSYAKYRDADAIARHVEIDANKQAQESVQSQGDYVDLPRPSFTEIGAELGKLLHSVKTGEPQWHIYVTNRHSMTFELQRKRTPSGDQFVVSFYDPYRTQTHSRWLLSNPSELEGVSLTHWIGNARVQDYCDNCLSLPQGWGTLKPWPPHDREQLVEALGKQHALVGHPVELVNASESSREQNLRAIPGGSKGHVLCKANFMFRGGEKYFLDDRKSDAMGVPKVAIAKPDWYFLIPEADLQAAGAAGAPVAGIPD